MLCYKYHGLGNDFLLFEDLGSLPDKKFIQKICHRRFAIGADGCIFLENSTESSVRMHFFNADGKKARYCGNAMRVIFYHCNRAKMQVHTDAGTFTGFLQKDGVHVQMPQVQSIRVQNLALDSQMFTYCCGVDHVLVFVDNLDIAKSEARDLRKKTSCNVSYVKQNSASRFEILTFEMGVEDFTLACGSASACLAFHVLNQSKFDKTEVQMPGGSLFFYQDTNNTLWMRGTAKKVALVHIDENF